MAIMAGLVAVAVQGQPGATRTPTLLGFTPFPYDVSLGAVGYTYRTIAANATIINQHFDNGV
ncbi:MAG: hypothetical protein MUE40_20925, partial [Anaerolineae bacterium]|nr:hypothetical protein [Anaerolineae bacterium]